jgi:hypothetical protein
MNEENEKQKERHALRTHSYYVSNRIVDTFGDKIRIYHCGQR